MRRYRLLQPAPQAAGLLAACWFAVGVVAEERILPRILLTLRRDSVSSAEDAPLASRGDGDHKHNDAPIGVVVGTVIGVICALALVVAALAYYRHRQRNRRHAGEVGTGAGVIDPAYASLQEEGGAGAYLPPTSVLVAQRAAGGAAGAFASAAAARKGAGGDADADVDDGATYPLSPSSADESKGGNGSSRLAPQGSSRSLCLADFTLLSVLGQGTFGRVLLVRSVQTGGTFALKVLKKDRIKKEGHLTRTKAERNVLERVDNPFIVKLHASFQSESKLYFVLDYHAGGDLYFLLSRMRVLPEKHMRFYACELVVALGYLHAHGVIYRDLKPENVLLSSEGHAILTDFGLCIELDSNPSSGAARGSASAFAHSFVGTPEYLAPEVILGKPYGTPCDFYALGVTLFELATGQPPFYHTDHHKLYRRTLHGTVTYPSFLSSACKSFLSGLLERDPAKRLGAAGGIAQLKQHAFFKGVDWKAVEAKKIPVPYVPEVAAAAAGGKEGSADPAELRNFERRFTEMPLFSQSDRVDAAAAIAKLGGEGDGAAEGKGSDGVAAAVAAGKAAVAAAASEASPNVTATAAAAGPAPSGSGPGRLSGGSSQLAGSKAGALETVGEDQHVGEDEDGDYVDGGVVMAETAARPIPTAAQAIGAGAGATLAKKAGPVGGGGGSAPVVGTVAGFSFRGGLLRDPASKH